MILWAAKKVSLSILLSVSWLVKLPASLICLVKKGGLIAYKLRLNCYGAIAVTDSEF